jgi:hypothetical protein
MVKPSKKVAATALKFMSKSFRAATWPLYET